MIKILDRYILMELVKPFLAGVAAFLIIMISNTLYIFLELIVQSGMDNWTVIRMLLYSLPAIIVVTLPVAYMFATLLALGRLAKDSEVIVMRACGVSLVRALMPILIVALLISALGYWLNETVVPWANRQTVDLVKENIIHKPLQAIKAKNFVKAENRSFYVQEVDRERGILKGIYVIDQTKPGYPQIITAKTAIRRDTRWILSGGMLRKFDQKGYIEHEIKFQTLSIEMPLQADMVLSNQRGVRELSGAEAADLIDKKRKKGEDILRDLIDLYLKTSLPLATFFTTLIAAPIGIRFSKMGNYFGVAVSIALVFVWYVTYSVFTSLGYAGKVAPLLAAWVQNIAFGGIGAILLLQMAGIDFLWPIKLPFRILAWLGKGLWRIFSFRKRAAVG